MIDENGGGASPLSPCAARQNPVCDFRGREFGRSLEALDAIGGRPLAPRGDGSPYPSNRLLFGKPLGGRRPASARLPIHSLSSGLATVNVRPAESRQVRPSAMAKTLASETPPSL